MKKTVNGVEVDLTDAERQALLAEEAEWEAGEKKRRAAEIDRECGMTRRERLTILGSHAAGSYWYAKAAAAEAAIELLGIRSD